jgi:UDP-N-acetylglucosamine--N-acetylmuramyl-(pentapeptide) pyrophosphoryl-undecaprenol N-acetylglucosamine transferase
MRPGGADILFVTGRRKMESDVIRRYGFDQVSIDVEGLKGRGWRRGALTMAKLPWSLFQALSVIRRYSPRLVLGVGGYSSGPVCLAAKIMGIPCAIQEQNSYPGLTNRLLCRVVDRVFISFDESREHFPCSSVVLAGNPVRRELLSACLAARKDHAGFTALVIGGSQGARAVNEAFLSALEILVRDGRSLKVIHQTGEGDFQRVSELYGEKGLQGEVLPFIHDMAGAYARADLVVSRAGATTLSELAALGKPSILVPYPYAANRHQELNASALVRAGGAEMILQHDLSAEKLARVLMKYMDRPEELNRMAERVKAAGRPEAVERIVDELMDMVRT